MKKEYSKPAMEVLMVKPTEIICGSGDSKVTLSSGSDEELQAEETIWGTGIFGE